MLRTRMLAAAVATAAASTVALLPSQAQAAGSVHLYRVYYDSPGSDTRSNSSLNSEWVQIKNSTSSSVQLKGYTLRDKTGYKFTFPSYRISAGKTVKVHTGRGSQSAGHVYWGRGSYVWNNDRDTVTLRTASGAFRDSCSYNSTRADSKMC